MFDQLDDTIVAISSRRRRRARHHSLERPDAFQIASRVFVADSAASLQLAEGYRRIFGWVRLDGEATLPAEAYTFRAPASYTRQDIVELHTMGSPPVLSILLDALVEKGARLAQAGEFTARAYFNGALDLTAVEGVAGVIHARSDSQLRASEALLHGKLSRRTTALREELADLLALLEVDIDFVEESIEFVSRDRVCAILETVRSEVAGLLEHSPSVERLGVLRRSCWSAGLTQEKAHSLTGSPVWIEPSPPPPPVPRAMSSKPR